MPRQTNTPCEQRDLFHPIPVRPAWMNLPPDVQRQALHLLARLLGRIPGRPPADDGREVRDE